MDLSHLQLSGPGGMRLQDPNPTPNQPSEEPLIDRRIDVSHFSFSKIFLLT